MSQVVHDPSRQQLPERDRAELRMLAIQREFCVRQPPGRERREILRTQSPELIEEVGQRFALTLAELCETIVGREAAVSYFEKG